MTFLLCHKCHAKFVGNPKDECPQCKSYDTYRNEDITLMCDKINSLIAKIHTTYSFLTKDEVIKIILNEEVIS